MEGTPHFITASSEHLHDLLDLSIKTFRQAFAALNTEENMQYYMERAFTEEQLKAELLDPNSFFYILQINDLSVGYLKLNTGSAQTDLNDPDSLEIQRIYVLPEYQRLKLGEQMIQKAIAVAVEKGLRYIWLGVWEKNEHAIRFYQRQGFTKTGQHPFPFGNEIQTDLIMQLTIEN